MAINDFFDFEEKTQKRTALAEPEELEKINNFTYDIGNIEFVQYFQSRTGIIITPHLATLYRDIEPNDKVDLNIKKRLQDCWDLYNQ